MTGIGDYVIAGAREHGLPDDDINGILKIAVVRDTNVQRVEREKRILAGLAPAV